MGRELYLTNKVFHDSIDRIDVLFRKFSIAFAALHPAEVYRFPPFSIVEEMFKSKEESNVRHTYILQPIFFAIQVSLFVLISSAGIVPEIIVGHSLGEIAASYCCGSLSLDDAVLVCYTRSRAQYSVSGKGFMAAVKTNFNKLKSIISRYENVDLAGHNSPTMCNVSGEKSSLELLMRDLAERTVLDFNSFFFFF
jgi:acyl transferase domain-containing protein